MSVAGNISVTLDQFVVSDKPFDPIKHWKYGPGDGNHKYSCSKKYFPIKKNHTVEGVMW